MLIQFTGGREVKIRIPQLLEVTRKDKDSFWIKGDIVLDERFLSLGHYDKWVYFVLCERGGRLADSEGRFEISGEDLERVAGVSRETIWRARKNLVKAGLIEEG